VASLVANEVVPGAHSIVWSKYASLAYLDNLGPPQDPPFNQPSIRRGPGGGPGGGSRGGGPVGLNPRLKGGGPGPLTLIEDLVLRGVVPDPSL